MSGEKTLSVNLAGLPMRCPSETPRTDVEEAVGHAHLQFKEEMLGTHIWG